MRIFVCTVLLSLAVFPHYVELISENLRRLFPESDGVVFPPIKTFRYGINPQLSSLRRIYKGDMMGFKSNSFLVARAHVIIGWKHKDIIRPISNLFGETDNVFDTNNHVFVSLSQEEQIRLGVDPRLEVDTHLAFIRAADQATNARAEIHRLNHQANPQTNQGAIFQAIQRAHYHASQQAYFQAIQQANYNFYITGYVQAGVGVVNGTYNRVYNQAYQDHIRNGHR